MTLEALIKNSRYNPCPPNVSQSVWKEMEKQRIAREDLEKETKTATKRTRGIKNRGSKVHRDTTKCDRNLSPQDTEEN